MDLKYFVEWYRWIAEKVEDKWK